MSRAFVRPEITVEELIELHPRAVDFLMDRGIVCVKCGEPVWGTLGELISRKGLGVLETVSRLADYLRGDLPAR